jgi:5-methylcytosine-specific restriction endonuclease McrA
MAWKPRRLCSCGKIIAATDLCACQIKRKAEADRRRPNASARGYDSAWQKARRDFLKKHPFCAMCGKPAVVVDHIKPHKGDKALFWDSKNNWQSLCVHHHSSTKQSQERRQ